MRLCNWLETVFEPVTPAFGGLGGAALKHLAYTFRSNSIQSGSLQVRQDELL